VRAFALLLGFGHSLIICSFRMILTRLLLIATERFTLRQGNVALALGVRLSHFLLLSRRHVLFVPLLVLHILLRTGNLFCASVFCLRRVFLGTLRSAIDILRHRRGTLRVITAPDQHRRAECQHQTSCTWVHRRSS